MLVLVKSLEKITGFKENNKIDTYEIVANLRLVNCDNLVKQAKEIDKEDYNENCFCVSFNYVVDEDKLYILNVPNAIYYVDMEGENNYLEVSDLIINNLERVIYAEFKKFLKNTDEYVEENKTIFEII
jgi:hypothetical protein